MSDFSRFGLDIDVVCYCGHKATLPYQPVVRHFSERNWPKSLDLALGRFRCTKCGSTAAHMGPQYR